MNGPSQIFITGGMPGDVIKCTAVRGDSVSAKELASVRRTWSPSRQEAERHGEDSFER